MTRSPAMTARSGSDGATVVQAVTTMMGVVVVADPVHAHGSFTSTRPSAHSRIWRTVRITRSGDARRGHQPPHGAHHARNQPPALHRHRRADQRLPPWRRAVERRSPMMVVLRSL